MTASKQLRTSRRSCVSLVLPIASLFLGGSVAEASPSLRIRNQQNSKARSVEQSQQSGLRLPQHEKHQYHQQLHSINQHRETHTVEEDCYFLSGEPKTGHFVREHHGCSDYVLCLNGALLGALECSEGMLFDEALETCQQAELVDCKTDNSEAFKQDNIQTNDETKGFTIVVEDVQAMSAEATPEVPKTNPPTNPPTKTPTNTPTASPTSSPIPPPPCHDSDHSPQNGYVVRPFFGCTQYMFCSNGNLLGNYQKCAGGLLFNPDTFACSFPDTVICSTDDSLVGTETSTTSTLASWDYPGGSDGTTDGSGSTDNTNQGSTSDSSLEETSPSDSSASIRSDAAGSPNTGTGTSSGTGAGVSAGTGSSTGTDTGAGTGTGTGTSAGTGTSTGTGTGTSAGGSFDQISPASPASSGSTKPEAAETQIHSDGGGDDFESGNDYNGAGAGSDFVYTPPANPIQGTTPPKEKAVLGYYASWQWYDREKLYTPVNIDYSQITRINYAFFQPSKTGKLYGTDSWADPQILFGPYDPDAPEDQPKRCSWDHPEKPANCAHHKESEGLLSLAKANGVEVYVSIGGWTLSGNFSKVAENESYRETFARDCKRLIEEYGFDGIDIDWEYPGYEDHSGRPQDRTFYPLLIDSIRLALTELTETTGKQYGITAAMPCGPRHHEFLDMPNLSDKLDELNLMTYDFYGAWDKVTGMNSPLYDQESGIPGFSVDGCVNMWTEGGGDPNKINIGLGFYGRSNKGATELNAVADSEADDTTWHIDEGSPQYFNIIKNANKLTTYWDDVTKTPWASVDGKSFVSYDDPRSICLKVEYAQKRGLHGYIIWELSGDVMDDLSTPLLDATWEKIQDPNIVCDDVEVPTYSSAVSSGMIQNSAGVGGVGGGPYGGGGTYGAASEGNIYSGGAGGAPIVEQAIAGGLEDTSGNMVLVPTVEIPSTSGGGTGDNADPQASFNTNITPGGNQVIGASLGGTSSTAAPKEEWKSCPEGYTGLWSDKTCENYMYCEDGIVQGEKLPCSPGTIFDETARVCNWLELVVCKYGDA